MSSDAPSPIVQSSDLVALIIIVIALSFGQASLFMFYRAPDIHNLGLATAGIFHGETHWRAFQNRLLGPGLVTLIRRVLCATGRTCDYDDALKFYYYIATCTTNLIFVLLVVYLRQSVAFGFACLMGFIGFQMTMWTYWCYPWDPIELSLFSILLLMDIKKEQPLFFFYTLFLFWVLNKETVVFISFWLLLTRCNVPNSRWSLRDWYKLNGKIIRHAVIMLAISISIIKTLRDRMFVKSLMPNVGSDEGDKHFGNFYMLPNNFSAIKSHLIEIRHLYIGADTYGSIYAIVFTGLLVYAGWRFRKSFGSLSSLAPRVFLFTALYFSFVILAGNMTETRVYLPLAPMVLALYLIMNGNARQQLSTIS